MYFSLYNPCHSPIDAYCPIHLTSKRHRGTEHVCPRSFPPWENIDSARSESHVCKFRRSSRIVRARHLFGQCFSDFRVPPPSHYPSPGILPRRDVHDLVPGSFGEKALLERIARRKHAGKKGASEHLIIQAGCGWYTLPSDDFHGALGFGYPTCSAPPPIATSVLGSTTGSLPYKFR